MGRAQRLNGPGLEPWQDGILEVAVLLLAAAAVGMSAGAFAVASVESILLISGALALIGGIGTARWWTRRRWGSRVEETVAMVPAPARPSMWRVRATLRDEPGRLASLTGRFAERAVNIVALQVHPVGATVVDEFLVEVPAGMTGRELVSVVSSGGGGEVHVTPADPHDLVDVPSRMLAVAAQVGRGPGALISGLRACLGDIETVWSPARTDEGVEGTRMALEVTGHGTLLIQRAEIPFTPAEFARARALISLDQRLASRTGAQPR